MERWFSTRRVFVVVLAAGLFSLAARDLSDPDIWWHLRTGQLILETRTVPHTDPFSYTRRGEAWITHEWLTEVFLYLVYRVAGKGALVIGFAAIIAAAFLIAYRRSPGRPYLAGAITTWGALASVPTWGVRPQMLTLLLASLFLFFLDESELNPRLLWWLPALTLLWVNLHGGYAVGIGLIALYFAGSALDWAFGKIPRAQAVPRLRRLAAVLFACLMLVPFNPSGTRLYWYPIQTLHSRALQGYISEWRPPGFHLARFQLFFWMVLFTFAALAVSRKRVRLHQWLLAIVTAVAALHSVRHIPIFALIAIPLLSEPLQHVLANRPWAQGLLTPRTTYSFRLDFTNALILISVLTFTALHLYDTVRQLEASEARNFPTAAASFLAAQNVPVPLLNHYDWGGYFIWRLYPKYLVWVDGRTDLYGDNFMEQFLQLYWAKEGWKQQLDNAGIMSVIVPPGAPLACSLLRLPGWQQIYGDGQAVILTRTDIPK